MNDPHKFGTEFGSDHALEQSTPIISQHDTIKWFEAIRGEQLCIRVHGTQVEWLNGRYAIGKYRGDRHSNSYALPRGMAWPQCVVFGLLDVVMFAEFGPLFKIRITLGDATYDEINSSQNAFREAGRDAGRNLIETVTRDQLIRFGP